jgi:hypothetical protein
MTPRVEDVKMALTRRLTHAERLDRHDGTREVVFYHRFPRMEILYAIDEQLVRGLRSPGCRLSPRAYKSLNTSARGVPLGLQHF